MILVIEDTLRHQEAAKAQLPEAKVVNYDEAYHILLNARPGEISGILTDLHFTVERARKIPNAPFGYYESNDRAIGTQLPFGLVFVLKAVELQTPVVLYSDSDHHSDLVTGIMDMFGKWGHYPSRKGSEDVPIICPKFVLLRDGGCQMAEDMHWDGEKIVNQPMPEPPDWEKKGVKDWRVAFRALDNMK